MWWGAPRLNLKKMTTGIELQFFRLTKIDGKNCRVIIDSGNCVNAVASGIITKLGLKTVSHPQQYKVSWVNSAYIDVKDRRLIPILFATYSDKIWCDVVTMDVGHIILGRLGYMTEMSLSMDVQTHVHLFMREKRSNWPRCDQLSPHVRLNRLKHLAARSR